MDSDDPMERLEGLQRDLIAFTENRLPNLERLSHELENSIEDLRRLLDKKKKNEESRKLVSSSTAPDRDVLKIGGVDYRVTEGFRQSVLQVADELDLDELAAAQLCLEAESDFTDTADPQLSYKALLRFHNHRCLLLDCLRLLLMHSMNSEAGFEVSDWFVQNAHEVVRGKDGHIHNASTYWKKCIDGLSEVEAYAKKIADHKQAAIMTGIPFEGDLADALLAQRVLLERQHETLGSILCYLIRGGHSSPSDFRLLLSKAAALDSETSISTTIHYFPALMSASTYFGADDATTPQAAKDLHSLFAAGPSQLQWKMPNLQAATTVWWLAEYSLRFADPTNTGTLRVADRQREEDDRAKLFFSSINNGALHLMLGACQVLRPEVWHDPAKVGLVRFLMDDQLVRHPEEFLGTTTFSELVMDGLQVFTDAFVANMPDVLRRLRHDEDDRRRMLFSRPHDGAQHLDFHLERFIVIMAYAYQDDPDAAQDFWADRDNNLYGFLRWVSQRLPTPRVAAFCELLTSISSNEKAANQAHRFLLEDTSISAGKLRKLHSVCWAQIFSELNLYAESIRGKPTNSSYSSGADNGSADVSLDEPETHIMLEAYLRLASHICRRSSDARNWILREQTFHLGEVLFQLASGGQQSRIHASCFNLLAALLTNKVPEVNDGMWVLLDNWIAGGVSAGASTYRPQPLSGRVTHSEKRYLQVYAANAETATGLVNLLNALVSPPYGEADLTHDSLPFPESLGAPHRHGGIDAYVDFVLGTAFKSTAVSDGGDETPIQLDVLRYACLEFIYICLSTFNEDLVALANTTALPVDKVIRTSSLAAYARLHPFGRVMDWMFNSSTITAFLLSTMHDVDDLNNLNPDSPRVQTVLKSVTVMNLAMKLQATYFDIVRPLNQARDCDRMTVIDSAFASYDEVLLSHINMVAQVASFAASNYAELSLESLSFLQKLCASKRLASSSTYSRTDYFSLGNRLVGLLVEVADALSAELRPLFQIYEWDLETGERPQKLVKAKAVLDLLNSSLDASRDHLSLAHSFLGFDCHDSSGRVMPSNSFDQGRSLFHAIAVSAAVSPHIIEESNISWLLCVKAGSLEVVLKLALSPLTASLVMPELRAMDILAAACQNQVPALASPLWDQKSLQDPELLLGSAADAVRDFLRAREAFFQYASLDLRSALGNDAYSVHEKIMSALLGIIRLPDGQKIASASIFDLFDFVDLETTNPSIATCRSLGDFDLFACLKDDPSTGTIIDVAMVHQLLILRKRELVMNGELKDGVDEHQLDDEVCAMLASAVSHNNWFAIQTARLSTLEAWTDLVSLVVSSGGLKGIDLVNVAQRGLQVVLPRFDKALSENMEFAALLAKLTLTLVSAAFPTASDGSQKNGKVSTERLWSTFRVCLKAITDSSTELALRDVCYRTCCTLFGSLPLVVVNGKTSPSENAQHLLQIVQQAGDRLISVITEDAFSGRGVTRVSSLLLLDELVNLFQANKATSNLTRSMNKLNFVPVLIDHSIGSVASSFEGSNDERTTTIAYFHTAMSLLLRLCQTVDGTQLVLSSGFFDAVAQSRLFSTDPDIGLDIDNPLALVEFYRLMSAVLRVITAAVVAKGPKNAVTMHQAKNFLRQNRFSMQAVFKRTSAVKKTAGPPEQEAMVVADEFGKLLLVTGFLEEDESAYTHNLRTSGFT